MKVLIYSFLKRIFDIVFSTFTLILLLPVFFLIAVLIKIDSRGPVFFRSKRVGAHFRPFSCIKFRTMKKNAHEILQNLLEKNPKLNQEYSKYNKLKEDPRVTRVGKVLRKWSLDELPQFLNVLIGDISVVGPRPYLIEEIESQVQEDAHTILSVKPGITGIWQTSGRSNLSFEKRIELEKYYVNKRSFFFDLYLVFKTIPVFLFRRGAC